VDPETLEEATMSKSQILWKQASTTSRQHGFSLIELVVTMLIIAILAAIAVPAYSSYVRKSRRTEAKSALLDIASLEERYFSTNNVYSNLPSDMGFPVGTTLPFPVGNGYYQITTMSKTDATAPANSTSAGTPATFTITATAVNDQAKDLGCQTYTVTSTAQQTATGNDSANCWR
jgi:type IV pilus assembly protein PilE